MAYQNVGTPRFYVNVLEWISVSGMQSYDKKYYTLPVVSEDIDQHHHTFESSLPNFSNKGFLAILGHNLNADTGIALSTTGSMVNIVNGAAGTSLTYSGIAYYGFSISKYDGTPTGIGISPYAGFFTGAVVIGTYYDMPNAPNLSLTISREYGGIKELETYNGSSMSNTMWHSAPKWGDLGAWELGDLVDFDPVPGGDPRLSKSGRRTWDLKFSYLQDSDVFPSVSSLTNYEVTSGDFPGGWETGDSPTYNTIVNNNSFYSQVWHKTLGGTLPFIFQPDSSNNNPDQFCIARFKDSSLKATQSAFNVYDISLSIEEVW